MKKYIPILLLSLTIIYCILFALYLLINIFNLNFIFNSNFFYDIFWFSLLSSFLGTLIIVFLDWMNKR